MIVLVAAAMLGGCGRVTQVSSQPAVATGAAQIQPCHTAAAAVHGGRQRVPLERAGLWGRNAAAAAARNMLSRPDDDCRRRRGRTDRRLTCFQPRRPTGCHRRGGHHRPHLAFRRRQLGARSGRQRICLSAQAPTPSLCNKKTVGTFGTRPPGKKWDGMPLLTHSFTIPEIHLTLVIRFTLVPTWPTAASPSAGLL